MADESIGQVSVNIVGDYSALEKSFNEAQNLAQSAGVKISTGLESGAKGADKLTSSMELTDDQVQNLFVDGMELANAWTKNAVGAEQAAASIAFFSESSIKAGESTQELGDKFQRVRSDAEAFEKAWGDALIENKRRTEELADATDKLESSVLSLVAAVVSFQAIKQLGEDSLMAYGHVQQLTTSLDLMGAGAKGAAQDVEKLRALAIQTATPFEELSSQARKLSAVFGTGQNMFAVLKAAADDAAGTGRSFDAVANGLERIEAVGTLTGRQLVTLGISWEQMAHSMGVSVQEAQHRMSQGVQSASKDVADTIKAIEDKFHDASERQAANVLGTWTNVKNQSLFIMQQIGEQMGDLGPLFSEALKVVASGVIAFIGGIQQVTVAVIGMVREGIEAVKGLGSVAMAAMKGDFIGAAVAAKTAYAKIKTESEYTNQSLQDHAKKTAESLIAIWYGASQKISAVFTPKNGGDTERELKATRDRVKGFQDLTGELAVAIAMYHQEISAQKAAVEETAKYNEANNMLITTKERLAMKTWLASESVRKFGEIELPKAKEGISELEKETNKLFPTMKKLGEEIDKAGKDSMASTEWGKMDAALKLLGLSADDLTKKTHAARVAAAEYIAANSTDMPAVTVAWQTLNSEVNRLSSENLPAAIAMQKELIASMVRTGEAIGKIYDEQTKQLELEIEMNAERGDGSAKQIFALELMKIKTDALRGKTEDLAVLVKELHRDYTELWQGFSAGVAHSILKGGEFWAFWHDVWQKFEQDVMTHVVEGALKEMAHALIRNITLGNTLNGVFNKLGVGGGGGGGGGLPGLGGGGGKTPSVPSVPSVPGTNAVAQSAGLATASAITGIITGAVQAVSAVIGNFQMAGMNKSLDLIENYTRYLKIGLVEQSDSLLNTSHATLDEIKQMVIQTRGLVGINLTGSISQEQSKKLLDDLVNSGENLYVVAARTLTEIRDSVRGGTELLLGQLHEIARGVNPSIGKQLLNSAISGLFGGLTGGINGIGSLLGGLGAAIGGGGSSADMGKIEEHTRFLAIGLVTQGDSLLNDMHVVRNVLTDFSKWNQDVVQSYYQGFAEKLDTLIGMGGMGAIHSSGMMASVSSFSASPTALAEAAPVVNINIDKVESDVTDAKVTQTMNRAFRMSKLAGALPPGRFPQ